MYSVDEETYTDRENMITLKERRERVEKQTLRHSYENRCITKLFLQWQKTRSQSIVDTI